MTTEIEIIQGDITTLRVDAIVNAANQTLLGGGVDGRALPKNLTPHLYGTIRANGGMSIFT